MYTIYIGTNEVVGTAIETVIVTVIRTAIGTKSASPYPCIFMDDIQTELLKTQDIKSWFWKKFINNIFFIWTESKESLEKFLKDLNKFHPNLKFTHENPKRKLIF